MLYINKRIEIEQQTVASVPNSATACFVCTILLEISHTHFTFFYSGTGGRVAVSSSCDKDCMAC